MELNQNISKIRKERGLSQEALAEKLSVSRQAVSKWETGEAVPELQKLMMLCDILGVSMDKLCGREKGKKENAITAQPSRHTGRRAAVIIISVIAALLLITGTVIALHIISVYTVYTTDETEMIQPDITDYSITPSGNQQYEFRYFPSEKPDDLEFYLTTENNRSGEIQRYSADYDSGRCLFKITLEANNDYTLSALIADKETEAERSVPLVVISAGNDSFTESDMLKKD